MHTYSALADLLTPN